MKLFISMGLFSQNVPAIKLPGLFFFFALTKAKTLTLCVIRDISLGKGQLPVALVLVVSLVVPRGLIVDKFR